MDQAFEATRAAAREASRELLARGGVVATGVGYKVTGGRRTETPAIVCSVKRKRPQAERRGTSFRDASPGR